MTDKAGNKTGSPAGGNIVGRDAKSPKTGQDGSADANPEAYTENSECDNNQAQKRIGG